jgi:natural product biosynthesis luciferase-like monooxygenase protein
MQFALIGSGQQLVACAELLRTRGHRIRGVISDCPQVSAWAQDKGVARITPQDDQVSWLKREPYDYLLSIVNHAITPAEVLATAGRGAINYHDSPLPEYAGFNATSWAIIDGKQSHAVTFHEMTAAVDGGRIFVQKPFEIVEDDTAFTLGAKCTEMGVSAFSALLDQLEHGALDGRAQGPNQSFHFRSDRPDIGALDFALPVQALHAFVRGLNFGPEDSWMCKPKLALPSGFVALTESRIDTSRDGAPGTILEIGYRSLDIAAHGGVLCLSELSTLEGEPLTAEQLRSQFGVREGLVLPSLDEPTRAALRDFDGPVTKNERFWVKRLSSLHAPSLAGLSVHADETRPLVLKRPLPSELAEVDATQRQSALVSAFAAYLTRVGDGGTFDLALHKALPEALRPLYANTTPLHVDVDPQAPFAALREHVRLELEAQSARRTYARDAVLRYGVLRTKKPGVLPIGVRFDGALALAEGTHLTLVVSDRGSDYALVHDEAALSPAAAQAMAERIDVLLKAALFDERSPVAILPLLPQAERALLLNTWQDTARPYASDKCVHELFEQQVERTPDATAIVFRDRQLTYRELNQRANVVAQTLRALGVGPDTLVGICVERSLEMMVSLLGIQKAGGAYVPLDPAYPRERLAIMLEDSKAKVLITQRKLSHKLPSHESQTVWVDELAFEGAESLPNPASGVEPQHLAYVIFTSGSTGRPKGVMVEHRNVSNFFTGMDETIGGQKPGVWLAVTSISFDISVLELFYTLTRGFEVVIQEESDRASLSADRGQATVQASSTPMGFGLFYFAADSGSAGKGNAYRLLIEGAKFADEHDFAAVWTPERHFHAFGGLYPNPSVTTAALATITKKVHLRAGSVVLPLHHPLRVAEDWAVIDHLSGGRIGLSFASGWHANDFTFFPENYERRREVMLEHIATVEKLWRGEKIAVKNGAGQMIEVQALPRPLQAKPPFWIASAGSVDTFKVAGRLGANVLTNMLGQDLNDLKTKFAAYREARRAHGHEGDGIVSVMLHTFVCDDTEKARELARKPFCDYLASSFDLVKVAPWMFPAFRQPSRSAAQDPSFNPADFTDEDMAALLEHAFDRYFDTAGLFGTPERALGIIEQLKSIGATEVACLIDFGVAPDQVLESLTHLDRLRQLSNPAESAVLELDTGAEQYSIAQQLRRRAVTHFQCTPSMARMLMTDSEAVSGLGQLQKMMLGGEALPTDLVEQLAPAVGGDIVNMYGPTETTIWSTTSYVSKKGEPITIGKPIANTTIRILDTNRQLVPVGAPGELCIGGAGVVRGYLDRPDLTAERFVEDPCASGQRIYRTGDLARYRADGCIEFLGRLDHQVKVNGYRIELGEIETVLSRHPAVRQSVVVARSDEGPAQLVGYVVAVGGESEQRQGARHAVAEPLGRDLQARRERAA